MYIEENAENIYVFKLVFNINRDNGNDGKALLLSIKRVVEVFSFITKTQTESL